MSKVAAQRAVEFGKYRDTIVTEKERMYNDPADHEVARFQILAEVSQQITSILDINELLEQVVRLIQKTFDYYHVGIGLVEGEDVVYRLGAGDLWDDPNFQFKPARLKIGSEGVTGWVAATVRRRSFRT